MREQNKKEFIRVCKNLLDFMADIKYTGVRWR